LHGNPDRRCGVEGTVVGRPLEESELVVRAQRGDASAYEELVRMHQAIAFRTAFLVTRSAEDAEEVAADAFLKAFRALGRFRRDRPFRPWLLTIVANEARNRRRAAGRRQALVLRAADESRPGDAAPSPEAAAVGAERRRRLLEAVERLPDDQRLVVECRFFLDLDEAETAAVLGVRRGTAKSRLSRALDRLREEVPEDA
jgi:RNA polymerase sigma-70 factor (ECF subfamily)